MYSAWYEIIWYWKQTNMPFEVSVLTVQLWCPVRTKIWSIWRLELKKQEVMKELLKGWARLMFSNQRRIFWTDLQISADQVR